MLMMRVTPKISDSPTATKNRPEALDSPFSAWNRNALKVIAALIPPLQGEGDCEPPGPCKARSNDKLREQPSRASYRHGYPTRSASPATLPQRGSGIKRSIHVRRPQLLNLRVARQHRGAVDIFKFDHGALAAFQRELADIGSHSGLMVARPVVERAERAVALQVFERLN